MPIPNKKEIKNILKIAETASQKAGAYLRKNFRRHNPSKYSYKKHREIVTAADKKTNDIIVKTIRAEFPDHNIVSEEKNYQKNSSSFAWYVDPLDGTTNYTAGIPLYSVNIGVTYRDEIICGAICLPDRDELYAAMRGRGSFCNNKKIRASKTKKIKESFVELCHSYEKKNREQGARLVKKITNQVRVYRRFGCAGVEHANVAAGRTDAIIIIGSRAWDNLAGALLIEEAGGKVTDRDGKPWVPNSKDFIATNGAIHERLLKLIQ